MEKNRFPLVSIVIPFHNNEQTLSEAIESAISQRYTHIEVLVVDDLSTDSSCEVVKKFVKQDSRVAMFANDGSGVSAARNSGLKRSKGEFVVFLDADDKLKETYIERALYCYENNSELTIVYSNMERFERETGVQFLDEFVITSFLRQNCIPIFAMVRTEQLKSIGGFDEKLSLCEDWECWMNLLKIFEGKVFRIEEPQYLYRKRFNSDSVMDRNANNGNEFRKAALYVFQKHQDFYIKHHMSLQDYYKMEDAYHAL